jgi:hypothetical protein
MEMTNAIAKNVNASGETEKVQNFPNKRKETR